MAKSRFSIAERSIKDFLTQTNKRAYTRRQLEQAFADNHLTWRLPLTFNSRHFIEELTKRGIVEPLILDFEGYVGEKKIFVMPGAEIFEIALTPFPKSYLSHYTAAFFHQLTNQVPKTIYITFEQSKKEAQSNRDELQQGNIDHAFSQEQRKTGSKAVYERYTIVVHNGMFTNLAGVYMQDNLSITNIERTLIDLTVRPSYAGGVYEVLNAYEIAKNKISVNKLIGILNTLNFTYPYAQAIGFYLQRAGYNQKFIDALKAKISEYDFYLTYNMTDKDYSKEWKLYFPKGM